MLADIVLKIVQILVGILCGTIGTIVLIAGYKNAIAWEDGTAFLGGCSAFFFFMFFALGFIGSALKKD